MARRNSWARHIIWGSVAVCAVLAASVTIALVVGTHRGIQFALPSKRSAPAAAPELVQAQTPTAKAAPASSSNDHEIARLKDALRALAAERDRLADRLETVERTVGDITASVRERPMATPAGAASAEAKGAAVSDTIDEPRTAETPRTLQRIAAAPTQPSPPATARPSSPAPGAIVAMPGEIFQPYAAARPAVVPPTPAQEPMQIHASQQTAAITATQPARESMATRTEFGVDLGSEPNMDGLRARWSNLRGDHGAVLSTLRPLVSVREGNRAGSVELRLIAGPLANAGDAARTCASLQAKGVNCQTAVFDGQRLALR
jgi:hypothetical protein